MFQTTVHTTLTQHGHKITKPRQIIIDIISQSSKPLNPYDIAKISNNTVNVATVYRTMELFEQLWLIHKIRSVDGYIACDNTHDHHCHHYAVCTNCHKVQEISNHNHNHTLPQDFQSDKQVYELTGKCKKCL